MRKIPTNDGSFTFFSEEFNEPYHSVTAGAFREALLKFCYPANVCEKALERGKVALFDFCFGLGYNTVAFLDTVFSSNPKADVRIVAVERDVKVIEASLSLPWGEFEEWKWVIREALKSKRVEGEFLVLNCFSPIPKISLKIFVGDGRRFLSSYVRFFVKTFDAVFHDPFSPKVCPELWSYEVFKGERAVLKDDGILVTYSASSSVRKALLMAGFGVREGVAVGRKSPSTVASPSFKTPLPLAQKLKNSVPYRDPTLKDPPWLIKGRKSACENLLKRKAFFEQFF